jgi:hypothetical protein
VISGYLCNCGSPRTSHAWQNMAALKKHFGFYTSVFCKVRALIVGQNRFSQRRNLPNPNETRFGPPAGEMDEKMDASVTTSHLLFPHSPGRVGGLLPISPPNSKFLGDKCAERAGGISQARVAESPLSKPHTEFYP